MREIKLCLGCLKEPSYMFGECKKCLDISDNAETLIGQLQARVKELEALLEQMTFNRDVLVKAGDSLEAENKRLRVKINAMDLAGEKGGGE